MQKPSLSPPNSRRILLTLCGGLNWSVLVLFTLFLLLSGLLVNFASDTIKSALQLVALPNYNGIPEWLNTELVAFLVLFIVYFCFLFVLRIKAKKALVSDLLRVDVNRTPYVDVLVMFLSDLHSDPLLQPIEAMVANSTQSCSAHDIENLGKHPWRMNLCAIQNQLHERPPQQKLELVVVTSGDSQSRWSLFKQLVILGFGTQVQVMTCSEFLADPLFSNTADFNDLQQLFSTLQKVQHKASVQQPARQVCFDATSGTKICSIAAAMVSLSQDQGLQYVSNDYKVKCYEVEYTRADD